MTGAGAGARPHSENIQTIPVISSIDGTLLAIGARMCYPRRMVDGFHVQMLRMEACRVASVIVLGLTLAGCDKCTIGEASSGRTIRPAILQGRCSAPG